MTQISKQSPAQTISPVRKGTRAQLLDQALSRGGELTLQNSEYFEAVNTISGTFLKSDHAANDLTNIALGLSDAPAEATILSRDHGVLAGLEELIWLLQSHGLQTRAQKRDGDLIEPDDVILLAEGPRSKLLSLERVGLNLLQRMSGIATATRNYRERVRNTGSASEIVATRKTLWGLLDKRAVYHGKGYTHRLGLGDAILIKNNHLALIAGREEEAVPLAIRKAWQWRARSAFIEVEVRGERSAHAAADTFRRLQQEAGEHYPCLVMLDNMNPPEIISILDSLRKENLWDHTLFEISGGVSESNIEDFAVCRADAISVGAITHSPRALDLCERIS